VTNCHQNPPEYEAQVRPLVGLTIEEAQQAWARAVAKAGSRKVTARMVSSAVQDLAPTDRGPVRTDAPKLSKADKQRSIDESFGQILKLLSQRASHDLLTEKIGALYVRIQRFLVGPRSQARPA
jgi:hypothetical protein